jgi:hypothetical protein
VGARVADSPAAASQTGFAPVTGRPDAGMAAKLMVLAAGRPAALERARPVLGAIGRKVVFLGEDPTLANVAKLAVNFTVASMLETLGEGFALARKSGPLVRSLPEKDSVAGECLVEAEQRNERQQENRSPDREHDRTHGDDCHGPEEGLTPAPVGEPPFAGQDGPGGGNESQEPRADMNPANCLYQLHTPDLRTSSRQPRARGAPSNGAETLALPAARHVDRHCAACRQ